MALPSGEAQEADVAAHLAWRRSFVPPCNMRAGLSYHLMIFLFDDMMRDLGFPARRKAGPSLSHDMLYYNNNF